MGYFTVMAKVEEVSEQEFERAVGAAGEGKTETVHKVQFSLVVPSMRDRVLCEMPREEAPKADILDRWELEESYVVVSADGMRALGFARSNARPGEKAVGALVVFQASEIREATTDERKALQQARKASKLRAKQRRAQRAEEKKRAKLAEQPVGQVRQSA